MGAAAAGCHDDPLYCDEDTMCAAGHPFCDIEGIYPASEGHGNTCIDYPWDAAVPDPDGGADASLSDASPDPDATLDPAVLAIDPMNQGFGSVVTGNDSAPATVTVSNTGEQTSGVLAVSLSGAGSGEFAIQADQCDGTTLEPAASCTLEVVFSPQSDGTLNAALDVDATPGGMVSVQLTGEGLLPGDLTISPTSEPFESVELGMSSAATTFTVENTGGATTGVLDVSLSDPANYTLSSDTCDGQTLGAGQTCTLDVSLGPATVGSKTGSISVSATPGGNAAASLGGTGVARLTIDKIGSGDGTVTSTPPGISCGANCSELFSTATVTLNASPAVGSMFFGWSGGGCSGTGSCVVTMDAAKTVTADFRQFHDLDVVFAGSGGGAVNLDPPNTDCTTDCTESYEQGTMVTLSAMPDGSSFFEGWSGGGCSGTAPCIVTMSAARTVTATFGTLHDLDVVFAGSGGGSVNITPPNTNCTGDCTQSYQEGAMVTLTATADGSSEFTGWSGPCSGTGTCDVTMDMAHTVTATFTAQHLLAVTLDGTGSGRVTSSPGGINCGGDCAEFYTDGTMVTLTAVAEPPASFAGWSGGGCSGLSTCVVNMTSAATVTATFQLDDLVATSDGSSCAIVPGTGTLRCWGHNDEGQLGLEHADDIGDNELPSSEPAVNVGGDVVTVAGSSHGTCALLTTGVLKCWGRGVGDAPGEMPPSTVSVPGTVIDVAMGSSHICAVNSAGDVYCWGSGGFGQLGYGSDETIGVPSSPVPVGGTAVAVATGNYHTCALLSNGNVRCWGLNTQGQLGYGHTDYVGRTPTTTPDLIGDVNVGGTVVQVDAGGANTCVLLSTGDVKCWGYGVQGRNGHGGTDNIGNDETPSSVPPIDLGASAVQIDVGSVHSCAVLDTGAVRCWGSGSDGRLGYGNEANIGDTETPASVAPVNVGGSVVQVSAGYHTCARLANGAVRCWGSDLVGSLGYGSPEENIGDTEDPATAGDVPYIP